MPKLAPEKKMLKKKVVVFIGKKANRVRNRGDFT